MQRLNVYLISLFFFLFCQSISFGQEVLLHDSVYVTIKSGELENALQVLSDKTGLRFGYRKKTILHKTVVGKSFNNSLSAILNYIISDNQLCYSMQGSQVIIHTACLPKYYSVSGNVLEDISFKPLPYISVSLAGKPIGVIADNEGLFELDIPFNQHGSDTLIFSSLGYTRDSLIIKAGKAQKHTIVLKPKNYPVPEVLVRPIEYQTLRIGNGKDRASGALYIDTHGQQTALFVENKNHRYGVIKSVEYFLSKKGNTDAPFRVRIYDIDSSGNPGTDLIEDAIVVKPISFGGWYSIDISMLSVEIPLDGVFISIEGVFPDEYQNYYGSSDFIDLADQKNTNKSQTLTYGQRIGYNRKCRKNTWHYSINKVWFQLEKQPFGVMIGAVVKYEKEKGNEKKHKNE